MQVTAMSDTDAYEHFGQMGPTIVKLSREVAASGESGHVPPMLKYGQTMVLKERYGCNGVAVFLLMQVWKSIQWRAREGQPNKRDRDVTRLADWSLADREGPTWKAALIEAGFRTSGRTLHQVWEDAGKIGADVGGPHGQYMAGATCGELAQLSRDREPHFFIDMMPWIIQGYWACGWDETHKRLQVL